MCVVQLVQYTSRGYRRAVTSTVRRQYRQAVVCLMVPLLLHFAQDEHDGQMGMMGTAGIMNRMGRAPALGP